jgi:beta-glucosidase
VLDGVKRLLGDQVKLVHAEGCGISSPDTGNPMMNFMNPSVTRPAAESDRKQIAQAVEAAGGADAVILVLGGNESVSREAIGAGLFPVPHLGDTDDLELPGRQNELAEAILKLGKPTVVVLLNGRPYSAAFLAANAPAILEGWYLGQETGTAVARVLFGEVNPGGKMPVTIARNVGQVPAYYYQKPAARRGYVLSNSEPLFPFGHGLSYTTFRCGEVRLAPATIGTSGSTGASVDVTNTGVRDGDEVVQLYIGWGVASVTRPAKILRGFERVFLKAGETRTVRFRIGPEELRFYNEEMRRVVEPGTIAVMIGGSSAKTVSAKLKVE